MIRQRVRIAQIPHQVHVIRIQIIQHRIDQTATCHRHVIQLQNDHDNDNKNENKNDRASRRRTRASRRRTAHGRPDKPRDINTTCGADASTGSGRPHDLAPEPPPVLNETPNRPGGAGRQGRSSSLDAPAPPAPFRPSPAPPGGRHGGQRPGRRPPPCLSPGLGGAPPCLGGAPDRHTA